MNRKTLSLLLIILSVFVLAACAGGDETAGGDEAAGSPEPTIVPTEAPTEEATDEPISLPESTPETVIEDIKIVGDFTVLVEALEATSLVELVDGRVPYTLFAPTDAAFEAYLTGQGITEDDLLANTEALNALLQYHLVYDAFDTVLLNRQDALTALDDNTIMLSTTEEGEFILNETVQVLLADVYTSNGVIHVVDAVLVAPEATEEAPMAEITEETVEATDAAVEETPEATAETDG